MAFTSKSSSTVAKRRGTEVEKPRRAAFRGNRWRGEDTADLVGKVRGVSERQHCVDVDTLVSLFRARLRCKDWVTDLEEAIIECCHGIAYWSWLVKMSNLEN